MSYAHTRLKDTGYVATSGAAVITNATGKTTYVRSITVHNTNTSSEDVCIYRVPDNGGSAGTASTANRIIKASVPADGTEIWEWESPGMVLSDTNDTIQASTDTASKVTICADGGVK